MTELEFTLTVEKADRLGLEPGQWWGFRLVGDDDERKALVTRSAAARDAVAAVIESGLRPPPEFEEHLASLVLEIPGW